MAIETRRAGRVRPASGGGGGASPCSDPSYTAGTFETDFDPSFLNATICARIREADELTTTRIIDANDPWAVDVHWELTGVLTPMICGKWNVRLILENLGPDGDDLALQSDGGLIDLDPNSNGSYDAHFSVPGGAVSVGTSGVPYEVDVVISYLTNKVLNPNLPPTDPGHYLPGPMAGIVEFPLTLFFDEGVEIPD